MQKDKIIKSSLHFCTSASLTSDTLRRYARHIVLSEIGEEGQKKLLASSALIIGAGGLGSAALAYLAAAGIGRLGIVEPDRVELSNLQRQVLFEEADIGRAKIEAAADRIGEVNPACELTLFPRRLTEANAREIIKDFFPSPRRGEGVEHSETGGGITSSKAAPLPNPPPQSAFAKATADKAGEGIILDCSDNFKTRFALADASSAEKKPLISAAISGFSAQLSTFKPYLGSPHPCYRCLVPELPERERTCEQEGIIGPLAGVMGSLQALEAIKELLAIGESLSGRLLVIDALTMHMKDVTLRRDTHCPSGHGE
jgi:molybdopterin/thiamine biosynthesis adenylyltransferase